MEKEKERVMPEEMRAYEMREEQEEALEMAEEAMARLEEPEETEADEPAASAEEAATKEEAGTEEVEDSESEKEAERVARIDILFGSYPGTQEILTANPEFKVDDNIERFMASVDGFMRGSGKKGAEIDEALSTLFSIGLGMSKGELTLDMLDILTKGVSYDRIIAEETRAAEIRGRNTRIEAKMRETTAGDGVPHPGTRGSSARTRNRGIFSLAAEAKR